MSLVMYVDVWWVVGNIGRTCGVRHKSLYGSFCEYCGDLANTVDHVPPKVVCSGKRRLLVRCCMQCNVILGTQPIDNVADRASYILEWGRSRGRLSSTQDRHLDLVRNGIPFDSVDFEMINDCVGL